MFLYLSIEIVGAYEVFLAGITPIPLDRHDTLEILNASVARLADMTVSGSQAIAISPNSTFPESITWSFPMLINPDGVGGINDTIQVQVRYLLFKLVDQVVPVISASI